MKAKILPLVLIRAFALYFLYIAVSLFIELLGKYFLRPDGFSFEVFAWGIFDSITPIICCWLFWYKAKWLANKTMGNYANEELRTSLTQGDIQSVGFVILGMYFLAASLISGARSALTIRMLNASDQHAAFDHTIYANAQIHGQASGVQLLISLFLIFGAEGISRIIKKLRHG